MEFGVNKDLSDYEKMTYKGFSFRMIGVIIYCIVMFFLIGIYLYDYLSTPAQTILIMLALLPAAAFWVAKVPRYNLPAEKAAKIILVDLLSPHKSVVEDGKENGFLAFLTKHRYKIPRSVNDYIPISDWEEDGICCSGKRYSVLFKFSDIDFTSLSDEDKVDRLMKLEGIISTFTDITTIYRIHVVNKNIDNKKIYDYMALPDFEVNPRLSSDFNRILKDVINNKNEIYSELYLSITAFCQNFKEASQYFAQLEVKLQGKFSDLRSQLVRLSVEDRIKLYHEIYHYGTDRQFIYDSIPDMKGKDLRSFCSPERWEKHDDHINCGNLLYRTLYLKSIGPGIQDDFWRNLTSKIPDLAISSVEIQPITSSSARNLINSSISESASRSSDYRTAKAKKLDISSFVPPQLTQELDAAASVYNDVEVRKQKLFWVKVLVTITGETKEDLENNTKAIWSSANEAGVVFEILYNQQVQGLFSCLPFGTNNLLEYRYSMTTESIAAFVPFAFPIIQQFGKQACWIGSNPVAHKVNSTDRSRLNNGHGMTCGSSGSGKGVLVKMQIISRRIKEFGSSDIIIIDPRGEYEDLTKYTGGCCANIAIGSSDYINVMDMDKDYAASGVVKNKISYLQLLMNEMINGMGDSGISVADINTFTDRCAGNLYKNYIKSKYTTECPTLVDLYNELMAQPEDTAHQIAQALETYALGSLNIFAGKTNIPEETGMIDYNIKGLDGNFRTLGQMVLIDQVKNRIARNKRKGITTYLYIDEMHTFFGGASEKMVMDLWKMGRHEHVFCHGIEQDPITLIEHENGRKIINNSEYLEILKCGKMEIAADLSRIVSIPPALVRYIEGETLPDQKLKKSTGLIKYAGTVIPFELEVPHDSYIYSLINTD